MNTVFERMCRVLAVMCVLMLLMSACQDSTKSGADGQAGDEGITVYYVNNDKTSLLSAQYRLVAAQTDTAACVAELLKFMQTNPTNLPTGAPIMGNVLLRDYQLEDTVLTLDFDVIYNIQDEVSEILNRAAIVRTLLQVEGVENIIFLVDGTALMQKTGEPVGAMNAASFLFNAGSELHTYDRVRILLYFANETGDALIPVYRTLIYNSNMSMERLIVEQLIMGPQTTSAFATINSQTKLVNVSLQDGICYVDLNATFIDSALPVSADVTIYSLVNSLTELAGVRHVQITVNGQAPAGLTNQGYFDTPLDRRADLIVTP